MEQVEILKQQITNFHEDFDAEIDDPECIKHIGDITLEEEIGRGAFAIVYKGRDKEGKVVAVKEIPKSRLNSKLLDSLKKEISILGSLNCDYIVRLFDVITTTRYFYLIMEFCNGGDLGKRLKKLKRMEEYTTQKVIYQVSKGLKILHENKIIHRDLKLSNFLIEMNENGTYKVKIADFGFATILTQGQDVETFCGTAPNMAPEVLIGYFNTNYYRNKYNEKADLWSMGIIIFHMITGNYPFDGKNPIQVMESIKRRDYSFPKDIQMSKNCTSIIQELLQIDPIKRLSFDGFFNHPFIKTDPENYLKELRMLWGEDYGLANTLETIKNSGVDSTPLKHYEKSELIPPESPSPALLDPIGTFYL